LEPRPYQQEAADALHQYVCTEPGNPCVVIPTGGGKSVMLAWSIQRWKAQCPWFRCIVLAHRKELVEQNAEELAEVYPNADIGVYSAGLGRRDVDNSITFASIDSVFRRFGEFPPFDVIMVDEAHRIPFAGEGKYRTFINGCTKFNGDLRVIGWTATPFRMHGGTLCHADHILNEVCYEANVRDLIGDGFLSPLRTKVGVAQPVLTGIRRKSKGDYVLKELSKRTNDDKLIIAAVTEAATIIMAEERKSVVFFCVDVEHCEKVSKVLSAVGIEAPVVTAKTPPFKRTQIVKEFKSGKLRAICNVNVYTEGFNARSVDCIVLLRPTLSPGLYSQMVGRGLRLWPGKRDCLVLDFARCIEEHGPIDLLGGQPTVLAKCDACREVFSRAIRVCPGCGWVISKVEVERLAAEEREKRLHDAKPSKRSILSIDPETFEVDEVFVTRHRKPDSKDSLRIQYRCGVSTFAEWVCLDHDGMAGTNGQHWWRKRFSLKRGVLMSVNEALQDLLLPQALNDYTRTVTVIKKGKYYDVIGFNQPAS